MATRRTFETHERVQRDLQAERGDALIRISSMLEQLIARLHQLAADLPSATGEARAEIVDAYQQTRKDALMYRWYLEVQRESVGVTRHALLDEVYPVPGPLDLRKT